MPRPAEGPDFAERDRSDLVGRHLEDHASGSGEDEESGHDRTVEPYNLDSLASQQSWPAIRKIFEYGCLTLCW